MVSYRRLSLGSLFPFLAVAAAAIALAGCAPDTLPPPQGSAAVATPTTGGPLSGTPEPDSLDGNGADGAGPSSSATVYSCSDGSTVDVNYPNATTAIVDYEGKKRTMKIAISADGARYVGTKYEWWSKGSGANSTATLYRHKADHSTGAVIANCTEQAS